MPWLKKAGKKAEPPICEVSDLLHYPATVQKIQRRLVAILADQLSATPEESELDTALVPQAERILAFAVLHSSHLPVFGVRSGRCVACWQGPAPGVSALTWLSSSCPGAPLRTPAGQLLGPRPLPSGCTVMVGKSSLHPPHRRFEYRGYFLRQLWR